MNRFSYLLFCVFVSATIGLKAEAANWCYSYYPNQDSPDHDVDVLGDGISSFFGGFDFEKTKAKCNANNNCAGFNTEGILKNKIVFKYSKGIGLYVKTACAQGQNQPQVSPMNAKTIAATLNNRSDCFCNDTGLVPNESNIRNSCKAANDLLYATYFVNCLNNIDFCSDSYDTEYSGECQNQDAYRWLSSSCKSAITPWCKAQKPQSMSTQKPLSAAAISAMLSNKMDCYCEEAAFVPRASGVARACMAPNDLLYATYFVQCLDKIDFCGDEDFYDEECQDNDFYSWLSPSCRNAITPTCK